MAVEINSFHRNYTKDSMPEIVTEYVYELFVTYLGDEKEISQIFVDNKRVGWLIPVLSMVSIDHDFSENKFFIKHVFEFLKIKKEETLNENVYVLILSRRILNEVGCSSANNLALGLIPYGIYPYGEKICVYQKKRKIKIDGNKICLKKSINISESIDFMKYFIYEVLPQEINPYARFMHFYQFYEIAMEAVFYKKILEKKKKKYHLGNIRDSISELSSERKLINILYSLVDKVQVQSELNSASREIFLDSKEDQYYLSTNNSDLIYDIRNTLVHNHYRFDLKDKLSFYCDYIEDFIVKLIEFFFENKKDYNEFFESYFQSNT